jgi:hypothetical protein
MSAARQALKRPADFDSGDEDCDIVDLCSSSSGDEAAGGTGNVGADRHTTGSEESDSDADHETGVVVV